MLVTLLGTGCPQVHPHRFGPASLVRARGSSFLIDCGSGVTQRMAASGVSGAALDAPLITYPVLRRRQGRHQGRCWRAAADRFVPVEFDRDALLAEVGADFKGPLVIGEDLVSIDVPRRAVR